MLKKVYRAVVPNFIRKRIHSVRQLKTEISLFREEYAKRNTNIAYLTMFIDWLLCFFRLGASHEDYFIYRFYERSWRCRRQFITEYGSKFFISSFNDAANDQRILVEDKTIFAEAFSEYTKRKIISSEYLSETDFRAFLCGLGKVIIKPADGYNGMNIDILKASDGEEAIRSAYESFSSHKYTIEEVLEQDGLMREINPGTCNTMRVNVINNNGSFEIQNAILRSGQGDKPVDNICAGGVVSQIDIDTGIVISLFCDLAGKRVLRHPLTGTVAIGRTIPSWDKVKATAIEAAKKISRVRYTSWDIAVIKNGDVAIVEGNTYGNFNIQQVISQAGVLEQYKKYL